MNTRAETLRAQTTTANNPRPMQGNGHGVEHARARRPYLSVGRTHEALPVLPAIFAAPPGVLMNAFLKNPWTFIQYMQEEMDRDFPTSESFAGASSSDRNASNVDQASRGASTNPGTTGTNSRAGWTPAMDNFSTVF